MTKVEMFRKIRKKLWNLPIAWEDILGNELATEIMIDLSQEDEKFFMENLDWWDPRFVSRSDLPSDLADRIESIEGKIWR